MKVVLNSINYTGKDTETLEVEKRFPTGVYITIRKNDGTETQIAVNENELMNACRIF